MGEIDKEMKKGPSDQAKKAPQQKKMNTRQTRSQILIDLEEGIQKQKEEEINKRVIKQQQK